MNCVCIIADIVVPLVSALIGGGLTLVGVIFTIRSQNKKDYIAKKASARPWIFSCTKYLPGDSKIYSMYPDMGFSPNMFISGIIKNTDNGILILNYVQSETTKYTPNDDNVVEKNSSIQLVIYLKNQVETLKDLHLYIKDIYGNQYRYQLILSGGEFTLGKCEEI